MWYCSGINMPLFPVFTAWTLPTSYIPTEVLAVSMGLAVKVVKDFVHLCVSMDTLVFAKCFG